MIRFSVSDLLIFRNCSSVHTGLFIEIQKKEGFSPLSCSDFRRRIVIIVKNKCIDILRKDKNVSIVPIDEGGVEVDSGEDSIENQFIIKQDYLQVLGYLERIDKISRLVLQMKYVDMLSYKEIGEILQITPKHVETRIFRAKNKIRKQIRKEGKFHEF